MGSLKTLIAAGMLMLLSIAAQAEDLKFVLVNNSSAVVIKIQISPVSTDNWGENILGLDVLLPGETATVTIADWLSTCAYDMLVTFNDETSVEELDYDFCDLNTYTLSD